MKEKKEIATEQVLQPDGWVFSSQSMVFPAAAADVITAPKLLDRYLRYIRQATFSVVRPVTGPHGVQFRLLGSRISLLDFAFPEVISLHDGVEVRLKIVGGTMVHCNERSGTFSFMVERCPDGVRVTVQLADFCSMLQGSLKPSLFRKLLYRFTQAFVHELITIGYLRTLYREVTGVKVHTVKKRVHLREGTPI